MCRLAGERAGLRRSQGSTRRCWEGARQIYLHPTGTVTGCLRWQEQRACALAQGADGTPRELEKFISKTKESSKLQQGCEDLLMHQTRGIPEVCEMREEIGVLLSKAEPGQEGAWCLQEGPGSTGVSGGRESSCASHLHPRQAELGDNPMMLSCAKGPPSSRHPFPLEIIPERRNLKETLIFG